LGAFPGKLCLGRPPAAILTISIRARITPIPMSLYLTSRSSSNRILAIIKANTGAVGLDSRVLGLFFITNTIRMQL
jgi:hypothetical protein